MGLKHLVIIAWEFPGVNSQQGTALAKRVGQIAKGFANENWKVTVIHKDQINENIPLGNFIIEAPFEGKEIKRYPVQGPNLNEHYQNVLTRKISTFIYSLLFGDRSYNWAKNVIKLFNTGAVQTPDLVISFFTPRGPLYCGKWLSQKYNIPWFADLQDNFDEGCSSQLRPFVKIWTQKILRSASKAIHVSPEWAERDGKILGINFVPIRHAIPYVKVSIEESKDFSKRNDRLLTILYAGSLNPVKQPPERLVKAVEELRNQDNLNIEIKIAGDQSVYEAFIKHSTNNTFISWLGWLNPEEMKKEFRKADCLLIISWADPKRLVVPSKLFEYIFYNKPILLAGEDSGSIVKLLQEWGHPNVLSKEKDQIKKSIFEGYHKNFSLMLLPEKCKKKPLTESELVLSYINLYSSLNLNTIG